MLSCPRARRRATLTLHYIISAAALACGRCTRRSVLRWAEFPVRSCSGILAWSSAATPSCVRFVARWNALPVRSRTLHYMSWALTTGHFGGDAVTSPSLSIWSAVDRLHFCQIAGPPPSLPGSHNTLAYACSPKTSPAGMRRQLGVARQMSCK